MASRQKGGALMGRVMMCAGGGKVTVEGLTAGVVKSGTTVTVKQGRKVIEQVTGTISDAAGINFAYVNQTGKTASCSLSVPAGTFKAFCVGYYDWYNGNPGGSWQMEWNGAVISSGTQIVGPGTLVGKAVLNSGASARAYTYCGISFG